MSTEDQFESPEFRQHIRTLLYDYSKTHLTTNYVTFTEDLVSELLEDLKPIPLTDPYSFVIPVDPFQTFSQIHSLSSLQPYDEVVPTTKEAIACIKALTSSKTGPPKTSRLEWTQSTYEPLPEPFFPALTRQSRNQTPRLGKKSDQAHRASYQTLPDTHGLVAIAVESIPEEKLDLEDILKVKYRVDPEELPAVKAVLKSTADTLRQQLSYKNKYLDPMFLCKIDHNYEKPEEQFMPIFPRTRFFPGSGAAKSVESVGGLKNFTDILPVINTNIKVEDPDGALSLQHLVVVDGWQTIQSSPPSTPSSKNNDSEDQRDQLFLESSPNTEPPLVEEITKSKMDVLIPRSRQIGGQSGIIPHILAGKTLQTFLHPLLSQSKCETAPNAENREERQHFPPSPTSSSLVGQVATELETHNARGTTRITGHQQCELDLELEKLYKGHGLDDIFIKETLDEKHDLLMEVPSLPEPNIHPPSDFHVPRNFVDFLVPIAENKAESNPALMKPEPVHQFLKKVKGKQSLQLALSWVTFIVDKRLPSVVELVGVDNLFEPSELSGNDHQQAEKLIKSMDFANTTTSEDDRHYSWTETTLYRPVELYENFQVLLNRQERMRLAKIENRYEENPMDCSENDDDQKSEHVYASPKEDPQFNDTVHHEGIECNLPAEESRMSPCSETSQVVPETTTHVNLTSLEEVYQRGNIRDSDRIGDARSTKRPRLDPSYYTSYSDPEVDSRVPGSPTNHLLAYDDSGYCSPGNLYEDNKENYPPLSSSWPMEEEPNREQLWDDDGEYNPTLEIDNNSEGNFEPLSLDSRNPPSGTVGNINALEYVNEDASLVSLGGENLWTKDQRNLSIAHCASSSHTPYAEPQLLLTFEPEIASHSLGISAFAKLRAKKISQLKTSLPVTLPLIPLLPTETEECRGVPQDLLDQNTIVVSGPVPVNIHRYMASLDFIQKHGLVRALRSEDCAVELVERQTLGGVDLIIDPYCAIIFLSLFTLPARCDAYVQRVAEQSWKFPHILVVLEAYPDTCATRSKPRDSSSSELYAYTPPIMKSIKKFRRDINIADAYGTKCAGTKVQYAFADSVQDAALLTKMYGCQAEERDETFGVIWGQRPWLTGEFIEEEERLLAGVRGMNHFSASIILSQITLEDFVELLPEERLELYSGFISQDALNECSADIESRLQALNTSSDVI